jgi:hypothetical protein
VVDSAADGIDATRALARIKTLLANASLVWGALAIDEALRVAVGGPAEVALLAAADDPGAFQLAHRVRAAGARVARLGRLFWFGDDS